jgi:phytoene dehydrogenase-like protein
MTERWDAIVIGAGHNGLVCAALLARANHSVLVLEANSQVGGAAVTREFADGYSVSAGAHLLYQLQPQVCRELDLNPRLAADELATISLGEDAHHVRYAGETVEGVSEEDKASYRGFHKKMRRFAGVLSAWLNRPPPRLGHDDWKELARLGRLGVGLRAMGRKDMREFLRLIGMNIHDELNECFYNPLLKGALSLDAVLGTHLGPRSPNTMLTYLYRLAGNNGKLTLPAGGMGSVSASLAQTARNSGVMIETDKTVKRIIVENGRVTGVETADGERLDSYTVVSGADPKTTIMDLMGARHVETGFVRRIKNLRSSGNAAKLHLGLDGLPTIAGVEREDMGERFVIAVDEHYVERAFNPAKYGEYSKQPVIEITIPSVHDETLAPAGKHVLSAVIQYAPYDLNAGWDDDSKAAFYSVVMDTIERYAPNIREQVTDAELLTPTDLENEFHMTGGHWHHGELTLDQFMFVRPVAGAAQYRMPIDGLYLCGAGTHPGGGVSGAAGRNAARTIIRQKGSS